MGVSLKGKSGVSLMFGQGDFSVPNGLQDLPFTVTDFYTREVNDFDVIRFYLMLSDTGVHRGRIMAPSFSAAAKRLAEGYSLTLELA
ncbi:MAG: hypothetical protein OK438_01470 [Thaumarchaeota archaeon]|nr:hypothetical protein [Nitrososphaerota archaeon]